MDRWRLGVRIALSNGVDPTAFKPPSLTPEEVEALAKDFEDEIHARFVAADGGPERHEWLEGLRAAGIVAAAESDRSVAIVQAAITEEYLREAIERHLPGQRTNPTSVARLFDPLKNGILSTFAGKVDIAAALGIISDNAKTALKRIGQIRNLFAHRLDIHAFDHPDASGLVSKLTYLDFAVTGPDAEGLVHVWMRNPRNKVKSGLGYRDTDNPFDNKGRFEKTCSFFQHCLKEADPGLPHPDLHE